jgi:hypothetical protein
MDYFIGLWLQEAESVSSRRRMEKKDSYPLQSGSGWGRELRNRFVFNNKDRDRSSTDYTLRSHYTEQGSFMMTMHVYRYILSYYGMI